MKKIILLTFLIFGTILFFGGLKSSNAQDVCEGESDGAPCDDDESGIDGTCQNGICVADNFDDVCSGESDGAPCDDDESGISGTCQNQVCVADDDEIIGEKDKDEISGEEKCSGDFEEISGVCFPINTGLADTPIADILSNALFWLLGIFGFFGIAGFVISGIQYLVSAGDEKGIETAKRNMKWSLVGVVVGISGMVIIKAITAALEATTSSF